jgi:hypothetical protein
MKKIIAIPVTLGLMVFCFGTGWTVAQTVGEKPIVRELFTAVSPDPLSAQQIQNELDPSLVRWRFVRVDLDRLTELESIVLNLFDDVTITAVREKVEHRSEGRYTWFGEVPGEEFNSVILTIENGDLVGGVRTDGKVYDVRPLGNGFHKVCQLDLSAFPRGSFSDVRLPDWDLGKTPEQWDSYNYRDDGETIDIMVVYTDDAARATSNINAEIQHAIDVANATYENSFISKRLRLVHTVEVNYVENGNPDADLDCITYNFAGCSLDGIHDLRDKHRADIVSFWVERMDGGTIGKAWVMHTISQGFEAAAFNVIQRRYAADPEFCLAHEVGHNMGAAHDTYVPNHAEGVFPYSHGYVWHWAGINCRPTIMAYYLYCTDNNYLDIQKIGYWSTPLITYQLFPSPAMPIGNADTADNARTLSETALHVANFRYGLRILRMAVTHVADNSIQYASWDGYSVNQWSFTGFSPIGGKSPEPPAMAEFMGRHYMAVKGASNNNIYLRFERNLGDWSSWETISGATTKSPALVAFNNRLYMSVKGAANNNIYLRSMDASWNWDSSWTLMTGQTPEAPALTVFNNRLYLFVRGAATESIYYRSMDTSGTWNSWSVVPSGTTLKSIGLSSFNNRLYVVVKGAANNYIYYRSMDSAESWSNWAVLSGQTTEAPSVTVITEYAGTKRLYVGVKGATNNNAYIRSMNLSGNWDSSWTMVPANTGKAPVLSVF